MAELALCCDKLLRMHKQVLSSMEQAPGTWFEVAYLVDMLACSEAMARIYKQLPSIVASLQSQLELPEAQQLLGALQLKPPMPNKHGRGHHVQGEGVGTAWAAGHPDARSSMKPTWKANSRNVLDWALALVSCVPQYHLLIDESLDKVDTYPDLDDVPAGAREQVLGAREHLSEVMAMRRDLRQLMDLDSCLDWRRGKVRRSQQDKETDVQGENERELARPAFAVSQLRALNRRVERQGSVLQVGKTTRRRHAYLLSDLFILVTKEGGRLGVVLRLENCIVTVRDLSHRGDNEQGDHEAWQDEEDEGDEHADAEEEDYRDHQARLMAHKRGLEERLERQAAEQQGYWHAYANQEQEQLSNTHPSPQPLTAEPSSIHPSPQQLTAEPSSIHPAGNRQEGHPRCDQPRTQTTEADTQREQETGQGEGWHGQDVQEDHSTRRASKQRLSKRWFPSSKQGDEPNHNHSTPADKHVDKQGKGPQATFFVFSPSVSVRLQCDLSERDVWVRLIAQRIADTKAQRKQEATRLTQHTLDDLERHVSQDPDRAVDPGNLAPVWIPNKASGCCIRCSKKFSLSRRRHHCRNCGNLVCQSCSSNKRLLPELDPVKALRVCLDCFPAD